MYEQYNCGNANCAVFPVGAVEGTSESRLPVAMLVMESCSVNLVSLMKIVGDCVMMASGDMVGCSDGVSDDFGDCSCWEEGDSVTLVLVGEIVGDFIGGFVGDVVG